MEGRKRLFTFILTWVAYATYYLGRRGFGVVKKPIHDLLGVSETVLGRIDTAYLTAYSLGQFVSGFLGDRVGARRLVGYGMLLSAAACAAFGSVSGALAFGVIFAVNGFAQSTGWPGTTRAVADWTTPQNRGSVMAFWSTCYQVGGLVAVWLAGGLAARFGWRSAFTIPALIVAAVGLSVLFFLPKAPVAPALPNAPPVDEAAERHERRQAQLAVVKNPLLWSYAASYFCVKLIRYAILFWLPYYLSTALGYSTLTAAGISTAFDAGGFAGVITIGLLSDRSRGLGRAGIASIWLFGLAAACVAYMLWGASGKMMNVVLLAIIGATLFGPDSILCGAAAMDVGGPRAASMASGFVNGVGSVGPILQGLVVPPLAAAYGWNALFQSFVVLALFAALILVPAVLRARKAAHDATPSSKTPA